MKKLVFIIGTLFLLVETIYADIKELTITDNPPYPKPWIKVPNEHPRLLMRRSDFGVLEKNMAMDVS